MVNAARELGVQMNYPEPEHWKALGRLIGYIKGKEVKGIIIRSPKVLKAFMFCDFNHTTDKETKNGISGLVATLGGTLLTSLSKNQRTVALIRTETKYVELSACAQEVNFESILMGEITKVQKPSVIY